MLKRFFVIILLCLWTVLLYAKFCPYCGNKIGDTATCPFCKNNLQITEYTKIKCPACGKVTPVNSNLLFCTNCGFIIKGFPLYSQALKSFWLNDYNSALEKINRFLKLNPYYLPAYDLKIEILIKLNKLYSFTLSHDLPDYIIKYTEIVKERINHHIANTLNLISIYHNEFGNVAEVLYQKYLIKKDINLLTQAINIKPSFYIPYILLAREYIYKKNVEKAREYINKGLTLFPHHYLLSFYMGLINLNNIKLSEVYFSDSIKNNPEFLPAKIMHAKLLYTSGKILSSFSTLKKIPDNKLKNISPEFRIFYYLYKGLIIDRKENFDLINLQNIKETEFLDYYKKAIELLNTERADIFLNVKERTFLNNLENLIESYEKGFINYEKFVWERKKIIFK